jgi:Ser/Thr protein kinase RdoA (MazF antagonist)
MRGDAWRISGRIDVARPLFDNLGMRGAKADQASSRQAGDDRRRSALAEIERVRPPIHADFLLHNLLSDGQMMPQPLACQMLDFE